MIEWEDCVAVAAADIWGAQNMQLAALDIAGAAFRPALTIVDDAAWTLAQRHGWHIAEDWYFVALRACHLTHRQPGHRDQPHDLADWLTATSRRRTGRGCPKSTAASAARHTRLRARGRGANASYPRRN